LPGKELDVCAWKWREAVRLQEVENALSIQISHNTNVIAKVEAMPQVDAFVPVLAIVLCKGGKDSKLDS
jgi:hypothetical protein